jgi:hypothetical protein
MKSQEITTAASTAGLVKGNVPMRFITWIWITTEWLVMMPSASTAIAAFHCVPQGL